VSHEPAARRPPHSVPRSSATRAFSCYAWGWPPKSRIPRRLLCFQRCWTPSGSSGLGFDATVCEDGSPNLSPKGTTYVWDDDHLFFADVRSPPSGRASRVSPPLRAEASASHGLRR
jgi:hypothetical protein